MSAIRAQDELTLNPRPSSSPSPGASHPVADPMTTHAQTPWRGAVVLAVAVLIAPVGYLGNEGMSPLVALGGLLTLPWLFRPLRRPSPGVWFLVALTAWAVTSFFWSPLRGQQVSNLHAYNGVQALIAPKLVLQFLLYGACLDSARRLSPAWRRRVLWALTVSVLATTAVLVLEGFLGGALYGRLSDLVGQHWTPDLQRRNAARGCYGVAVLAWPSAAVLWRREMGAGAAAMIVGSALSAILLGVDAPVAAILTGLLAFILVRRFGRAGIWGCLAATLTYLLITPAFFLARGSQAAALPRDIGKVSWRFRLDIWRFSSSKIVKRPLSGWGLDSSRAWPAHIPMHPHDAAIQLWLETGVVGVVLTALFWTWMFWRIAEVEIRDRNVAAVMSATAAAYLTIGAISFGVWQEWWLALGAFAIAACAMLAAARRLESLAWGEAELVALS